MRFRTLKFAAVVAASATAGCAPAIDPPSVGIGAPDAADIEAAATITAKNLRETVVVLARPANFVHDAISSYEECGCVRCLAVFFDFRIRESVPLPRRSGPLGRYPTPERGARRASRDMRARFRRVPIPAHTRRAQVVDAIREDRKLCLRSPHARAPSKGPLGDRLELERHNDGRYDGPVWGTVPAFGEAASHR